MEFNLVRAQTELGLSPSQAMVCNFLAYGLSNKQIAQQLSISPATVRNHLVSVYAKTKPKTNDEFGRIGLLNFLRENEILDY